jgi:hypothetical protein
VAPDGATVIAGQAPAGSDVTLICSMAKRSRDRRAAARQAISRDPDAAPLGGTRIMSLLAVTPDGTEVPGGETVIIAPFGIVEEAAPEADAEPQDGPEDGAGDGSADATIDIAALETAEEASGTG